MRYIWGYDIFISYSRKDTLSYANKLKGDLENRGFKCFLDSEEGLYGGKLSSQIERGLKNSQYLILLASQEAERSDYVKEELTFFIQLKQSFLSKQKRLIIPVNINETLNQNSFPSLNNDVIWIDELSEISKENQTPSKTVVEGIQSIFKTSKIKRNRKKVVTGILSFFVLLVSFIFVSGIKPEFGEEIPVAYNAGGSVYSCDSYDSKFVFGDEFGKITITKDLKHFDSLPIGNGLIYGVEIFNEGNNLVAVGLDDTAIVCWGLEQERVLWEFNNPHQDYFVSIDISSDENVIALGDDEGAVWILSSQGELIDSIFSENEDWGRVEGLSFHSDNEKLTICYLDQGFLTYDFSNHSIKEINLGESIIMAYSVDVISEDVLVLNAQLDKPSSSNQLWKYIVSEDNLVEIEVQNKQYQKIVPIFQTDLFICSNNSGEIALWDSKSEEKLLTKHIVSSNSMKLPIQTFSYDHQTNEIIVFSNREIIKWKLNMTSYGINANTIYSIFY